MEHKGIPYSVGESVDPNSWKWTVDTEHGTKFGTARNRTLAILPAIKAIDKDQRQIRATRRKSELDRQ